jgi:hypothetical protein
MRALGGWGQEICLASSREIDRGLEAELVYCNHEYTD